jgi:SAM-dependent methyltransferase
LNTAQNGRDQNRLTSAPPEEAYDRLTGYAFARRHAAGKTVADLRGGEPGLGEEVLSGVARSVTPVNALPESEENPESGRFKHEDDSFDVVLALQVIERVQSPEHLISEAKRILKPDGVLIISTPDKQARSNERNLSPHTSEMYVREFQELLERHFGNVSLRRQGAVAGGFVSGASEELGETPLESAQLSSSSPSAGSEMPPASLVLAVCSDAETPEENDGPYLLLDRDRRVFEEDEDHREDIELLRDEVRRMQETEVQSFQNTIALRTSEVAYLRSELGLPEDQRLEVTGGPGGNVQELKEQNDALKQENEKIKARLHSIEGSNIWRLTSPYRRARLLLDSWLKGESRRDGDGR